MKQRLMLALALALMLVSTAAAQYIVIGPPDDLTYIDTTAQAGLSVKPTPLMTSLGEKSSPPVSSINITQLDCSLFPLICTYVEALDAFGNPVGGLTADSFCVYQDGILIGPGNFTIQQLSLDSCITSICLVVDVSGSMTEGTKFTDTKNAMRRFVRNMDAYDRVAIVSFASTVTTVQTFTSDTTLLLSKINGLVASGNTAAFDGIWQGVNVTVAELGSKAVIAFTDGLENRSHITPQPPNGVGNPATQPYTDDSTLICNFAKAASIPIYTFNLGSITNTYYNTEAMEAFAKGTGGFWRHAPSGALIDSVYDEIKVRICSRYKICYTSLDTIQNGTIHVTKICHKVGATCVGCDEASCQEQAPPVIVRTPPTINLSDTCQVRTSPLQICVKVTDLDTPPASFTVRLFYRLVGSPGYPTYTDVGMTQQGGPSDSIFCYTVPANLLNCRSSFEYYITASDGQYTLSNPAVNPQSSPYSVAICPNLPPVVNCKADTALTVCSLAQICLNGFSASDPDGNLATVTVSPGTISGGQVCFTPIAGANLLRVIATDSCGVADTCTTTVTVVLNSDPIVQCHSDTSVAFCAPGPVCIGGFVATDVNNNIVSKTTSLGTLTGTTVCFNAPATGVYPITFIATDACGKADTCTTNVTVTINAAPIADAGRDSTLFQCTPAPICITAACSDPNGNLSTCQLVSGPGTYNGSTICFTPAASGTYTLVLKATDACGLTDYDTSVVNVTLNQAPVADAGRDSTLAQCTPAPICITAACSDPNGNLSTCQLVSGPGTYNGSAICFTPAASGTYTLVLKATDACGLTDYDTSVVNVTLNQAPVADAGRDSTLFQCTPAPICITAACSDPNGNLSTCQLVSGPGTYNGSTICFTPAASGTYTLVLKATDACGLTDYDTSVVNVTLNQAPVADAGRDSTLFQCTPAPICITAACSDPNGNLSTCQLVSGPGTYNGSTICFTPAASGSYTLVLKATDACGLTDYDTSVVNVTLNQAPIADAGRDSTLAQCTPAPICITAACSDPNGNLSTCQLVSGPGTYNGSTICFTPAASGTYTLVLKATDACGLTDYDTSVVNVTLNQAPIADAGRDSTLFQCTPAPICITAACSDPNSNLSTCQLVSGPGTYNGSQICFTPASAGTFTFVLKATDACGLTDYDTSVVNVTLNQAPVADAGRDSTLFQCTPAPICITAACSDPNSNLSTCQLVSGPGTYNGSTICFTPAASGTYTLVLKATDACGLTDYDTSVVNVTLNQAPVADAGRDSTLFQCTPAPICITAACSDPNGNLSTCQLVSGPGTYNGSQICFTPAGAGTFTFVLKATDACGATDYDTSVVTVTVNQPPVASLGNDSTVFQCGAAPICIPASCSDPNSNLSTCQLVSGPGTYNGSQVCFTPAGAGVYTFVLKATDACGATDFDTAVVTVTLNLPPIANAGRDSTLFQCAPAQICIAAGCTDPNANLTNCELTSGPGTLNGGGICFTPAASGIYTFIVKATDACGLTDFDTSVVNVTINQAPVADAGRDSTLFQCNPIPICINASCSDPNGNLSTCQLVSGPGTYNGVQICFTAAASGIYTFVLKATDACGATDFDTSVVNVTLNQAPVANAGRDSTLFQCTPAPICITAACSDPNGNLSTCQLISGPGTYNGSQICFTPAGAGTFTFILKATDACGATDLDTSVVTVTLNTAPIANCHGDTTVFACNLSQICIPGFSVTDANNNIATTTVTGGTLNAGSVCFTPVVGPNIITVIVTDACGLVDTCRTIVSVILNAAPVANAGADQNLLCQTPGQPICWAASCTDPNNNLTDCSLLSGPGTYNGSQICFTPASSGTFAFVLKATDACGATDLDTAVITVRLNNAPTASVDQGDTTIFCSETGPMQICVPFTYSDVNGNVQTVSVSPAPTTLNYTNGSGLFCFTPANAFDDVYNYTVTVTDSCGLNVQTTHSRWVRFIDCDTATCFIVKTEKTHNSLQGHYEYVSVTIEGAGQNFGGFDFLMSYDNSGLNFVDAQPGSMLTTCGWEYFTYRYGAQGNCTGSCPSGLVRIIAVADANNGPNHPTCYGPAIPSPQELFRLKFLVTNDRNYECQYVPVRFFWLDCGDNSISTVTGDTLYIEKRIFSFEGNPVWDEFDDALYPDYNRPFGVGAQDYCMLGLKYEPIRCIEFWEGGVDIVCADSIDAPGDLNLNGIAYEIADAVLYTNYFLYGIAALDPDPMRREAQIAASDVNRDGTILSVGDLVYLVRVIVGDALPFGKLTPFANTVTVNQEGSVVSTDASVEIGAALLVFNVGESYTINSLTDMTVAQNEIDGQVRVLIYDFTTKSIAAGSVPLLEVSGEAELVSAEIADYNGSLMTPRLEKNVLPTSFSLGQNYPNPFNPETVIEFALPKSASVLITVYNTAGQKVATVLNEVRGAGRHQVRWNGKDNSGNTVSSGVYLYKFESEGFTQTRKMLLVK